MCAAVLQVGEERRSAEDLSPSSPSSTTTTATTATEILNPSAAAFSISIHKPSESDPAKFKIRVLSRATDRDVFLNGIGRIPACQHFGFADCNIIWLAGYFYVLYRSDELEKNHDVKELESGALQILYDNFVQK
jgi:hypothetical protein